MPLWYLKFLHWFRKRPPIEKLLWAGYVVVITAFLFLLAYHYPTTDWRAGVAAVLIGFAVGLVGLSILVNFFVRDLPPLPEPFREKLQRHLRQYVMDADRANPPHQVWEHMLNAGEAIWSMPQEPPVGLRAPEPPIRAQWQEAWEKRDQYLFEAIERALMLYIERLPRFHRQPFTQSYAEVCANQMLVHDMAGCFYADHMRELNLGKPLIEQYHRNTFAYLERNPHFKETPWPKRYAGPMAEIANIYLKGTPLLSLFQVSVPYNPFTEQMRFTHHWCLGDNGTGKTTYLRHLIKQDLESAAAGECSVIVMDSKKLVKEMRTLKDFAPGERMDGNLILIDSEQPFPLNPFMLPASQASSVIAYMVASDASKLQLGALKSYVDAVMQSTNKSLQTLLEYIQLTEKELPRELPRFDKDLQNWFVKTRKTLHSMTEGGVEQRLANFLREHKGTPLLKSFEADDWRLDFEELHKGGKVLLVDTDRARNGDDGAHLLGRLIIGLIDQLARTRDNMDESTLKPVWVYIDEAQDYIRDDKTFALILEKARSSRIGVTVAHHHKGQVDARIEHSLQNAGIKSHCIDAGKPVNITLRSGTLHLPVPRYDFEKDEPQMDRKEYEQLRAELASFYPYETVPEQKATAHPLTQKF